MTANETWVTVVDSQIARLLHGVGMRHEHLHLDEVSTLATTFVPAERHRPTRFGRAGRSGSTAEEHMLKVTHFAREVATWIEQELVARNIARCALFAPSHFLGALRNQVGAAVAGRLTEHEGELAQMSTSELSRHPRILQLLPA